MNGYVMNPSWLYCTCCMPPLAVNGGFVRMCKRGALQFVFLKPVLAVITVVLYTQHKYTEGYWGANNGQVLLFPESWGNCKQAVPSFHEISCAPSMS